MWVSDPYCHFTHSDGIGVECDIYYRNWIIIMVLHTENAEGSSDIIVVVTLSAIVYVADRSLGEADLSWHVGWVRYS
jgi:hypothetical protein